MTQHIEMQIILKFQRHKNYMNWKQAKDLCKLPSFRDAKVKPGDVFRFLFKTYPDLQIVP